MTELYVGAAFAILFAAVPYALLRKDARRRWAWLDAGFYALALALVLLAPLFELRVAPSLLLALFVVLRSMLFFGVAALARSDSIRWSANIAGAIAAAFYLLLIPHVLQWPPDGDEPFYLLITQSILEDGDLDLANQYRELAHSPIGRPDLRPQFGDPTGPRGEQYSRHEPLLALLMVPGYAVASVPGALATIAIFGGLLIRSMMLLLAEAGISERARIRLFPFLALGPPVIFYATRVWPEVPAAFFFAEALRSARRLITPGGAEGEQQGRGTAALPPAALSETGEWIRLGAAGVILSLLKLRFLAIAAVLFVLVVLLTPEVPARRVRHGLMLLIAATVPFAIFLFVSGSALNIHQVSELTPKEPLQYLSGFFGLLLDGAGGMLFQAPLLLISLFLVLRWRQMPPVFRVGVASTAIYLLLLFPRAEWYGGWSPPLRYLVVFIPLFALAAGRLFERAGSAPIALLGAWTAGLTIHGIAFPWRLFHLANGENEIGEWLSTIDLYDYSRLFPSFVRVNAAAFVWSGLLVLAAIGFVLVRRIPPLPSPAAAAIAAIVLASFYLAGRVPPRAVELESSAVGHLGGALYPEQWTVMRYLYTTGWRVSSGDALVFRFAGGPSRLMYMSHEPALIAVNGTRMTLPQTNGAWRAARMNLPRGTVKIEIFSGLLDVDRIERE